MDNVIRFGVSIEPALLKKFDDMITRRGYSTRSEALRDLIRKNIVDETLKRNPEAPAIGTLTLLYDHHEGNLATKLLHLQHDKSHDILTTMHIHVDHTNCLEIIVLRGKTASIQRLADSIRAIKGIKSGDLILTKTIT